VSLNIYHLPRSKLVLCAGHAGHNGDRPLLSINLAGQPNDEIVVGWDGCITADLKAALLGGLLFEVLVKYGPAVVFQLHD